MQRAKGGGDFCLSVAPSVKFYVNALMHADSNCSFPQIRRSKILLITSVTPFFPKTKVFISAFLFFFFQAPYLHFRHRLSPDKIDILQAHSQVPASASDE